MKVDYTIYYSRYNQETEENQRQVTDDYRQWLLPLLPKDTETRVVDVGCGTGYALQALRVFGFTKLCGVEADEGQANSCRAKGLDVELTADTAAWLRSRPAVFDLALSFDVIEHVPVAAQLDFVAAIAAALRPGGRFICRVPNANSSIAARYRYNDWTHHASFTEYSLDFLLQNAGFRDIKVLPVGDHRRPPKYWLPFLSGSRHWWTFKFFRLLRRLEMMAGLGPGQGRAVPLSLNILALARRPGS
jgi:SAM-dependent methyltransferase